MLLNTPAPDAAALPADADLEPEQEQQRALLNVDALSEPACSLPEERPGSAESRLSASAHSSSSAAATPPAGGSAASSAGSLACSLSAASEPRSDAGGDSADVPTETPADAPVHEVRCGALNAKLHMQRFTCPGIHRRCIEFEGAMITPREFTIKAEKDKQKDWKGSIRFGRYNLRSMMESQGLDFYRHAANCSQKCQSRNYIKNRKSEAALESGFSSLLDSMVPSADSRTSSNAGDLLDENHDFLGRKRSSALEDYVAQTIHQLNAHNHPLSRLIKEEQQLKAEAADSGGALSFSSSGANSTTTSVGSPPHNAGLLGGAHLGDFGTAPSHAADPTALLLQQLLEQQKLVQQQAQPPHQLAHSLLQTIQKAPSQQDSSALVQMALVALQMNSQHQQQQAVPAAPAPAQPPTALNLLEQCLLASQGGGVMDGSPLNNNSTSAPPPASAAATNFPARPLAQQTRLPYITENTFSVASINRVMQEEPLLFWSRMRDIGCLDELLDSIALAVDRLRSLYAKRDSSSEEEEFAARRLSDVANLLELGAVFGEKIQSRFVQPPPVVESAFSKEMQMALALQQAAAKRRAAAPFDGLGQPQPDLKKLRMA